MQETYFNAREDSPILFVISRGSLLLSHLVYFGWGVLWRGNFLSLWGHMVILELYTGNFLYLHYKQATQLYDHRFRFPTCYHSWGSEVIIWSHLLRTGFYLYWIIKCTGVICKVCPTNIGFKNSDQFEEGKSNPSIFLKDGQTNNKEPQMYLPVFIIISYIIFQAEIGKSSF